MLLGAEDTSEQDLRPLSLTAAFLNIRSSFPILTAVQSYCVAKTGPICFFYTRLAIICTATPGLLVSGRRNLLQIIDRLPNPSCNPCQRADSSPCEAQKSHRPTGPRHKLEVSVSITPLTAINPPPNTQRYSTPTTSQQTMDSVSFCTKPPSDSLYSNNHSNKAPLVGGFQLIR